MNLSSIESNSISVRKHALLKLQSWLQYGKHSWSLAAFLFYLPFGFSGSILKIAVLVFTPFMLWQLYKAGWIKSIVVFLLLVALPYLVTSLLDLGTEVTHFLIRYLPIVNFFLFTYAISYMIGEELNELHTKQQWEWERR